MRSVLHDAVFLESFLVDIIAVDAVQRTANRKVEMMHRIAKFQGVSVSAIESCDCNELYSSVVFEMQFRPDQNTFFKGRLGHKRNLGIKAHIDLTDAKIEESLLDPDGSTGFYSTPQQYHLSILVRLKDEQAWRDHYLPRRPLRQAVSQICSSLAAYPPSEAFRHLDGVMLVWLFDEPFDSESLTTFLQPKLDHLGTQMEGVRIELVGTVRRSALIPFRGDMVDGIRLLPIRYEGQISNYNPVRLLGISPARLSEMQIAQRAKIRGVSGPERAKYCTIRNALVTHFSSRRRKAIVRLFNYIWTEHAEAVAGNSTRPPWVAKKFGPDCVPLLAASLKLVDDNYKSVLLKLEEHRVLVPVGNHSHGQACHDPHPKFYWLDRDAVVPIHRGHAVLLQLKDLSDQEIAKAVNVTPRTVRNWRKRPETMPRATGEVLLEKFGNRIEEGKCQ